MQIKERGTGGRRFYRDGFSRYQPHQARDRRDSAKGVTRYQEASLSPEAHMRARSLPAVAI